MTAIMSPIQELGLCLVFIKDVINVWRKRSVDRKVVFEQIWKVFEQSLPTTCLAGFFVGAIMTVQFTMQIQEFGALGYLGGLSTSGTVREVGPLLIAFMLSGKVGAFTSAELGTMRVTEQIDAIRCLGADPLREIILPRLIAIIVSSFFLLFCGLLMSTLGGALMAQLFAGINPQEYIRHIPTILSPVSIFSGFFKCLVFAVLLAAICTYRGYTTTGGAKGVGRSVVNTAVGTMVAIVVADWLTSYMMEAALSSMLVSQ